MHNQRREQQPYEDCQAKLIQEFGWTLQGMDWDWGKASRGQGQGIKSHHTQTCQGIWLQLSSEALPELRRRRTGLLPSGPKSSFQMRASFVFHLETNVSWIWRKGGEAHSPSCLKSSVKFPQSVMIWGAMSSAGVGPFVFFLNQLHCTYLPRNFGAPHASFCWPAF